MLTRYAEAGVIGICGVSDHASVPDMSGAERVDASQCGRIEVAHLTATVFGKRTVYPSGEVTIAEKSW